MIRLGFWMLGTCASHLTCFVFGHRVPWGKEYCSRCDLVPGDELAP